MALHFEINTFRFVRLLTLFWGILVTVVLLGSVTLIARPFAYQPLGDYPKQQIIAPRGEDTIPVVSLSAGLVPVRGMKCVNGTEPVFITSVTQWRREEGNSITTIAGTAGAVRRKPGCLTFEFQNVMPSRVTPGIWQITGSETASGDGLWWGVSQTKNWETEYFRVVP